MTKRCVVGFDDTEPSRAALSWALQCSDPVVAVHVVAENADAAATEEARRRADQMSSAARRLAAELGASPPLVTIVDGPVAPALTQVARADDLLVIGTHKTGFAHGRLLGSLGLEIATLARGDVRVVPTVDLRFRSGVVVGIPAAGPLDRLIAVALDAARGQPGEVLLAHATESTDLAAARVRAEEALDLARSFAPAATIRTRVSTRRTAEFLLDLARDRALLVLSSGDRNVAGSPLGAVRHDILLNLTAPVLLVAASTPAQAA